MLGLDPLEGRFSIWTRNAEASASAANRRLAQAEQRIAEMEEIITGARKNSNAVMAVVDALKNEIATVAPNSPLLKKENRLKIYNANYTL
jgi:ABC-type transporter Mla subunit MlaD